MSRKKLSGFTLIELLIVVVIVGVLAMIALPSYQNHLIKGRRSAAQSHLMDLAQREQQYFIDKRAYTTVIGAGGLNTATPAEVSAFYTIAIAVVATPPGFTLTATPKSGTPQATDGALTLDNAGTKTPAGKW